MVPAELYQDRRRHVVGIGDGLAAVSSREHPGHEQRVAEHMERVYQHYQVFRLDEGVESVLARMRQHARN